MAREVNYPIRESFLKIDDLEPYVFPYYIYKCNGCGREAEFYYTSKVVHGNVLCKECATKHRKEVEIKRWKRKLGVK